MMKPLGVKRVRRSVLYHCHSASRLTLLSASARSSMMMPYARRLWTAPPTPTA